jgi:DNA-binding CsgD family transcriptional regulator
MVTGRPALAINYSSGISLSIDAVHVYAKITKREDLTRDDLKHLDDLTTWGLVAFDPDKPDVPVALDPHEATQRRLAAELAESRERVSRMAALPALAEELGTHYARAGQLRVGGSEYLVDPVQVNARLDDVVGSAREEILSAQRNGPQDRARLNRSVDRDQAALTRGLRMRTLYRDSVRASAITAEYARILSGLGAEYRTLVDPYERCIVVDRRIAFVSDHVGDPESGAAWCVTDRAMVAWIAKIFDEAWRRANPWHGEVQWKGSVRPTPSISGGAGAVRTTPLQRAILRDMADGTQQQTTASRLGISLRTLTTHITDLKGLFGAVTRPELTYKWALSPDRLVDDSGTQSLEAAPGTCVEGDDHGPAGS